MVDTMPFFFYDLMLFYELIFLLSGTTTFWFILAISSPNYWLSEPKQRIELALHSELYFKVLNTRLLLKIIFYNK
jgi:hypothetical protein